MNIDDLTLGQLKEIQKLTVRGTCEDGFLGPWEIGDNYLIRTVTMTISGKLMWVGDKELVLSGAAWIADTGRFSEALEDQDKFNEVEPFKNDVIVGRGSIIDATKITKLIRTVK